MRSDGIPCITGGGVASVALLLLFFGRASVWAGGMEGEGNPLPPPTGWRVWRGN